MPFPAIALTLGGGWWQGRGRNGRRGVPGGLVEHPEASIVVVGVSEEGDSDGVSLQLQVLGHLLPAQVPPLPTGLVLDGQVIVAVSVASLQPERISEGKLYRLRAAISDGPSAVF